MKKIVRALLLTCLVSALAHTEHADAARGWLGAGAGGSWAKGNPTTNMDFAPSVAFVIGDFLLIGGRIEAIVNPNASIFDGYNYYVGPQVMLRLPAGFIQFYAGGTAGIDVTFDLNNYYASSSNISSDYVYGPLAGLDIFLGKRFSIGAEVVWHHLHKASTDRYQGLVTMKWQFGGGK